MALVTVTISPTAKVAVTTPVGRLSPGDSPIAQVVPAFLLEKLAADLSYLEGLGLVTFTVSTNPAVDDRFQIIPRNVASVALSEFQGSSMTFYVPLINQTGVAAADTVVIAPGTFDCKQLRILDAMVITTNGQASGACQLFDTAAGGGTALTAPMAMVSVGPIRHVATGALGVMVKSKGLYARKAQGNAQGELVIWARAEY